MINFTGGNNNDHHHPPQTITRGSRSPAALEALRKAFCGDSLLMATMWDLLPAACRRLKLTPREVQVMRGIWCSQHYREIATDLTLSRYTVEAHWHRIRAKLNITTRREAIHIIYATIIELHTTQLREQWEAEMEQGDKQDEKPDG